MKMKKVNVNEVAEAINKKFQEKGIQKICLPADKEETLIELLGAMAKRGIEHIEYEKKLKSKIEKLTAEIKKLKGGKK